MNTLTLSHWRRPSRFALAAMLALAPARAARAQDTLSRVLVRRSEAVPFFALGVVAVAIMPADQRITTWIRGFGPTTTLTHASDVFNFVGDPGTVVASAGIWAVGAVGHNRRIADAGLHIGESVVTSGIVTGVIKVLAGRARPYVSSDTNARDFQFMRGRKGGDYQSFPSGHSTAAFAFAAALSAEAGSQRRWVAPVSYSAATLVALARMYTDKHWASDVIFGAGIGITSAKATVRFNHARPGNWVDKMFLPSADNAAFHLSVWPSADGRTNVGLSRVW
ncbi:MAG TPA: phosphatase PAP2 family protein [Gemmatimonadaceae bacterium]